jgi:hypothetical protein
MSITLFTNITTELTQLEKETLVPIILQTLERYKPHQVTAGQLCHYLRSLGYEVTDVRIRKMVNYIRVTNAAKPSILIGSSKGYFLTAEIKVVDEQIESLEGRIDSMKAALDSIKSQRLNLVHQ